ncbi:MAG: hypothetical protein IH631_06165, partial [Candidatus Thorarchaeota archaeon]|nr:hypothetical protein [Candidatus Thorarchaeota archaeon]
MQAILWNEFSTIQATLGLDERPVTYVAEQKIMGLFQDANDLYGEMDWIECFNALNDAQEWIDRLSWSTLDDTAPVISAWGVNPNITTTGFEVIAQVVDDLAGIENVTAYVQVDGGDAIPYPCTYYNSEWHASIPSLTAAYNIEVWVVAWDWGMNRAESIHESLIIADYTLYIYITIIGGVALVVIIVILVIRKRG